MELSVFLWLPAQKRRAELFAGHVGGFIGRCLQALVSCRAQSLSLRGLACHVLVDRTVVGRLARTGLVTAAACSFCGRKRGGAARLLRGYVSMRAQVRDSLMARAKEFNILVDDIAITHLSFGTEVGLTLPNPRHSGCGNMRPAMLPSGEQAAGQLKHLCCLHLHRASHRDLPCS